MFLHLLKLTPHELEDFKCMQRLLTQTLKKIPSFLSGDDEPMVQNNNSVCSVFLKNILTISFSQ